MIPPLDSRTVIMERAGNASRAFFLFLDTLRKRAETDQAYTLTGVPDPAKVERGTRIYVIDTSKPAWSDGTTWRYSDGTAI